MTEKFEKRLPKVGEFIRLTDEYKKKYPQYEDHFSEYIWKYNGVVQVIKVEERKDDKGTIDITTQPNILKSGNIIAPWKELNMVEVLIGELISNKVEETKLTSNIYCSCPIPSLKENWAGWNKFFICSICKKERK